MNYANRYQQVMSMSRKFQPIWEARDLMSRLNIMYGYLGDQHRWIALSPSQLQAMRKKVDAAMVELKTNNPQI